MMICVLTNLVLVGCPLWADDPSVVCGHLDYDGEKLIHCFRNTDAESWILVPCEGRNVHVDALRWIAWEGENDWLGTGDWALWDAQEVENGCANDETAQILIKDVPNSRRPLLDEDGQQVTFVGLPLWVYTLQVDAAKPEGRWYFGTRNVIRVSRFVSSIPSVPCVGDEKVIYFQSDFFGFPCARRGQDTVGSDRCVAVEIISGLRQVNCDAVRRFRVRCRNGRIKARVKSALPTGTELAIDNNGALKTLIIDDRGRGKVKWRGQSARHVVCILECGECRQVECA